MSSRQTGKKAATDDHNPALDLLGPRLREGGLIAVVAVCIYLSLALFTFDPADPGWTYTGSNEQVHNLVGLSGAWIADAFFGICGYMAFVFPVLLAFQSWLIFRDRDLPAAPDARPGLMFAFKSFGLLLTLAAGAGLAELHFYEFDTGFRQGNGGIMGQALAELLVPVFSYVGTTLILLAVFAFGLTAFADLSWINIMESTGRLLVTGTNRLQEKVLALRQKRAEASALEETVKARKAAFERQVEEVQHRPPPVIEAPKPTKKKEVSERVAREKQGNLFKVEAVDGLPAIHLLESSAGEEQRGFSADDLEAMSRLLELKLKDYNVEAEVVAVYPGPVITRFEIQPAAGVKVSRISGLAKDLARSLAVISVRVVEVIPGKSVVGIEIPNEDRQVVRFGDVLASKAYDNSTSPLSLALGHDIAGEPVVVDLARMPHLLVAGTTGSGKSVGLNVMILSILFKASPEEVRLIMVDPKMLELAVYEGVPHLLTPVVTDMKDAANALRWCVAEMERRYRLMAAMGVRNMAGFNKKVKDARAAGEPLLDPLWLPDPLLDEEGQVAPELEPLPYIVVLIDEFADMMMIVGKKVEELIARIAQKARAAGIHLILATQRPSVDVITGLIKANVPARIGFQVSSKIDSRTILDQGGAEQLLGHGDMLYLPSGSPIPVRVHGAFVDDDEVHRVVARWKELGEPSYLDEILDSRTDAELLPGAAGSGDDENAEESDPLYDEAVQFVIESRRASISSVQRKLRIGYNRAARMIEAMEHAGVVSEMNSNGSREVLVNAPEG